MAQKRVLLINPKTVSGARYVPAVQIEIDTEELEPSQL